MNVQRKLVGLHHIDAPWRPSDLEQREGRILRQGNEFYEEDPDNFEVEVIRYSTKQTYDARMWQTIEYKAAGIEQFRVGDSLQRVIDDVAGEAANAAEMKAAATGNPLIFLQVQLSAELKKLEALQSNHRRNQHSLSSRIDWLSKAEERANVSIAAVQKEIELRDANTTDPWIFKVAGKAYGEKDKEALFAVVLGSMKKAIDSKPTLAVQERVIVPVGRYRGFDIAVYAVRGLLQFQMAGNKTYLPDNLEYMQNDKFSVPGFIQRLDNSLRGFELDHRYATDRLEKERIELPRARAEAEKPFLQAQQLELVRKDFGQVMVELKNMQNDGDYVSAWVPESRGGAAIETNEATQVPANSTPDVSKMDVPEVGASDLALLYKHAESVAREHGYKPRSVNVNNGIYVGSVVALTDEFVIQDIGMRLAVVHRRDADLMKQLKVGDNTHLRYSDGNVTARNQDKQALER